VRVWRAYVWTTLVVLVGLAGLVVFVVGLVTADGL
jgi:hypothetical protein